MNIVVVLQQRPVEPTHLIVLAIGVVVAVLASTSFIAHQYHGDAKGEQRNSQKILHLLVSQLLDFGIIRRALDAAVPATVVVRAVAVVFAVRFVVLLVIGDKVVESEAVVARYKVYALLGLAFLVTINLRAAQQTVSHSRHRTLFTAEERADVIAKPPVPFFPTVSDEAADLVE